MNICDSCGDSLMEPTAVNLIIFKGTGGIDRDDEDYKVCNACRIVIENVLIKSRKNIEIKLKKLIKY